MIGIDLFSGAGGLSLGAELAGIALTYIPCKEYNVNYCEGIGNSFEGHVKFKK